MAETGLDHPAALNPSVSVREPEKSITLCLNILFGLAAAVFFMLAVIGTIRNYSPVPFGDMWDDYIGFYLRVHANDWNAWWAFHSEHRLILARLFFWIDIAWFHGNGIFSLAVIYLFALTTGLVFAKIWQEQSNGHDLYILFFVEAWIFSWGQRENLTWAFQSQFILAQMLPLAALYFLHLSFSKLDKAGLYFVIATICGILAIGSMANGVLALPAMAVYALIAGKRFKAVVFFAVLSACEIYLYFQNFSAGHFPGGAPSLTAEVSEHIGAFVQYVLMYLGSPVILPLRFKGFERPAIRIGEFSAILFILMSIWAFVWNLRRPNRATLPIALLVFIFYIIATAVITAAGRLPLGLDEALSSRYLTPVLYGWAAALLLFWPSIAKRPWLRNVFSILLAAFLCFVMLPRQLQALSGHRDVRFQREVAALPLELQINDASRIRLLYPLPDAALTFAIGARAQHLSIFGFPPLENAHLLLGEQAPAGPPAQCRGALARFTIIPGAPQYVRATGWLFNSKPITTPAMIYLVNETNRIVGIGLVGEPRVDIAHIAGRNAKYSGFEAYLSAETNGQRISVISPSNDCTLPATSARF